MNRTKKGLALLMALCMLLTLPALAVRALAAPQFTNAADAADYLRPLAVARETDLEFSYVAPAAEGNAPGFFSELVGSIKQHLYKHTGVGAEGDYLRYHNDTESYSSSQSLDGSGTVVIRLTYSPRFYTNAAQEAAVTEAVNAALIALSPAGKSEYERICDITSFICEHVSYDYAEATGETDNPLSYSAYGALIDGKAVCQGYANLFYRLALEAGLDCRIITGIGNSGPHAWVIVKIGGLYYQHDPTWIDSAGPEDNTLCGSTDFIDHYADDEFLTPAFTAAYPLAETRFVPGETSEDPADAPAAKPHTHTPKTVPGVPATCKAQGLSDSVVCATCGEVLKAAEVLPLGDHVWNDSGFCMYCDTIRPAAETAAKGDVDGDGAVTAADARLALRAGVRLEIFLKGSAAFAAADADGDDEITAADARLILRVSVRLETF